MRSDLGRRAAPATAPPPSALLPELCALFAALLLGLADALFLATSPTREGAGLIPVALATIFFTAALAAVALRLGAWLTRLGHAPWLRALTLALLALPVTLPVSFALFRGTGIAARPVASYGPYLAATLLFAATLLGARATLALAPRLERARWPLAPLATAPLAAALLVGLADRRLYPNQYEYLHWVLLLLTTLCLLAGGLLLFARLRPTAVRWLAPAALVASLGPFVWAALHALPTHRARQLFAERTHVAARLVATYRSLLDLDRDGHSVVFGNRDCDNHDPSVHPFAEDLPENGRDEDCDGVDARRPPPPPRTDRVTDPAAYRRRLAGWRAQPDFRRHLDRTKGMNVVLLLVDTLRADVLRPSAEARRSYPRLTGLLASAQSFERAFSTGAGTDIGMATVLTGQLDPFRDGHPTLFERFQRGGYSTYGVYQREVERWLGRQIRFQRGLTKRHLVVNDPYRRDVGTQATAGMVVDAGISFLEQHRSGPFFLWLHFFDVHEHHQIDPATLPDPAAYRARRGLPFYRSLLRYVDGEIGRFLDALSRRGLDDRTIVVLASDHGEGLAQAPRLPLHHGDVLFNPLIHVPLGMRLPGLPGRRLAVPVSLADLYPSLADLCGLPSGETHGLSLLPYLFGLRQNELRSLERPLLLNEVKQHGIIVWPWKLLVWRDQGLAELYDLASDFGETSNLVDALPDRARSLSRLLGSYQLPVIDRLSAVRRPR
ncbi:MAG: sulfatase-like hydrolase/transferase [Deltaproteobacteria bacterium]|nr:sulfatase-like hydrolase/transferase [Deltaproteobacteria bacterium]